MQELLYFTALSLISFTRNHKYGHVLVYLLQVCYKHFLQINFFDIILIFGKRAYYVICLQFIIRGSNAVCEIPQFFDVNSKHHCSVILITA